MKLTDKQGNRLTGASIEAIDYYGQATEAYQLYRGDPVALADQAIAAAPEFVMAHILKAYLFALATEPEAAAGAAVIADGVSRMRMNECEASHLSAIDSILAGEWTAAAHLLDQHNMRYPHDIVALQAGHLIDFFRANARNLRDRIARVLPSWSKDMPGYSVLLGMYSFGLEESGNYDQAEDAGREALDFEPLDCWAHHAVAHVMEMQGRPGDGIAWMNNREPHWSANDNLFKVHNWWHKAVYCLDLGRGDEALALYDGPVREAKSVVAADLIDASSLLWRVTLAGHDVGQRWKELSDCWEPHADGKLYPFNDWHGVMAHLGADRLDRVTEILNAYGDKADASEVDTWKMRTGLPLIEGFTAFWRGDFERSVERLYAARHIVNSFGGSHAQRDIIDLTLVEAAIRSGTVEAATALSNERIAIKPNSLSNQQIAIRAAGSSMMRRPAARAS